MAEKPTIEELLGPAESEKASIESILDGAGQEAPSAGDSWGAGQEALSAPMLGFGPELRAAGYALSHAGAHGGLGQAYEVGRKNFQAQRDAYAEANPITAGAIDLVGSAPTIALAGALTPAIPGAAALASGGRLARTALSLGRGAALGAEAGALETKLTGGSLGENALQGAELGAGLNAAGRAAKAVLGPGGPKLPIHHGRFRGFSGGLGMGLGLYTGEKAVEYGMHAIPQLVADPAAAATAGLTALATATAYGAIRAVRRAAGREALGLRASNWERTREGLLRGGAVNALGGSDGEQE